MLLPTQGQLPAAVALAIAVASPGAAKAEGGCLEVRAPHASRAESLKAIRDTLDRQSFDLLKWVAELQTRLDDPKATMADIGHLVSVRSVWLSNGVTLAADWAAAQISAMDDAAGAAARHAGDAITAGRLTAFALRAGARMPATVPASAVEGAEAAIHATLQPLYNGLAQFRVIEARLVLSAKRAALKAEFQALAKRNLDIVRLAKIEVLRVVSETAKLAFIEIPPREARAVAREAVLTIPADSAGSKAFGKRIDYHGLANRWVATP